MGRTHEAGGERIVGQHHCGGLALALEVGAPESRAGVSLPAPTRKNQFRLKLDVVIGQTLTQADETMFRVERVRGPAHKGDDAMTKFHEVPRNGDPRSSIVAANA